MSHEKIPYPYLPEDREILYVPDNNEYMLEAKHMADNYSSDKNFSTGAVIVRGREIVGRGANQTAFHKNNALHKMVRRTHTKVCFRKMLHIKSGEYYWVCPGCASEKQHAEQNAIKNSRENKQKTQEADLYLWGHWWCCKSCWDAMIDAGIKNVFLSESSKKMF